MCSKKDYIIILQLCFEDTPRRMHYAAAFVASAFIGDEGCIITTSTILISNLIS